MVKLAYNIKVQPTQETSELVNQLGFDRKVSANPMAGYWYYEDCLDPYKKHAFF